MRTRYATRRGWFSFLVNFSCRFILPLVGSILATLPAVVLLVLELSGGAALEVKLQLVLCWLAGAAILLVCSRERGE